MKLPSMHRKRWISILELAVAAGFLLYAFFGISVPADEWNNWATYNIPATYAGVATYAIRPISFNAVINIVAPGSLSVNNPITVSVYIYNTNDTSFGQDYAGVSFTWCYPLSDSFSPVGVLNSCFLPLTSEGNGTFLAKGTVKWLQAGPSYLFLVPRESGFVLNNEENLAQYESVGLTMNPVTDTLSSNFNYNILRLTFTLVGFSVLMLHPVLEAALLPHEDHDHAVREREHRPEQKPDGARG